MKRISWVAAIAVFFRERSILFTSRIDAVGWQYPLLGDISGHQQNPPPRPTAMEGCRVAKRHGKRKGNGFWCSGDRLVRCGCPVGGQPKSGGVNEVNPRVALLPDGGGVVIKSGARGNRISSYAFSMPTQFHYRYHPGQPHGRSVGCRCGRAARWHGKGFEPASGRTAMARCLWSAFTAHGVRDGAVWINQSTARNQSMPNVAALNGDRFVVCWVSERSTAQHSGAANANLMARPSMPAAPRQQYRLAMVTWWLVARVWPGTNGGFTVAWVQTDEKNMNNLSDVA